MNVRIVAAVVVVMPAVLVGLSLLVDRSPVPSLIEFGVWCVLTAAAAKRVRRGAWRVVAEAKGRGVELPARRSSKTARRNGLLLVGLGIALTAAAIALGMTQGAATGFEQAVATTLGIAAAVAFLAALVAGLAYYGDEKVREVPLP